MKQLCLVSQPRRGGSQRPPVISRHASGDSRQRMIGETIRISNQQPINHSTG
ncbi:hypothetical protein ACFFGQ_06755 [Rufibacter quisquiliarum]|uniref:Uncharacterized protein n=1 Tax=Rufibacter quisquiliarum TaxID=1549639 RepID=A0A839GEQ8_9BACT|nr:hypothetical protein [Rufibacter quisquiliarum]